MAVALRRSRRRLRSLGSRDSRTLAVAGGIVLLALAGGKGVAAQSVPTVVLQGASAACSVPDPTTDGCLTLTTAHGLAEIVRVFGPLHAGPTILSAGCWDPHTWNPTSDHPKGRACDLFPGQAGVFASGAPLDHGWQVAKWLRANATALRVRYVIWQGRIWQADLDSDIGGWGHPYNGGGVYDPSDATGGHYDHVHASFQP